MFVMKLFICTLSLRIIGNVVSLFDLEESLWRDIIAHDVGIPADLPVNLTMIAPTTLVIPTCCKNKCLTLIPLDMLTKTRSQMKSLTSDQRHMFIIKTVVTYQCRSFGESC